MNVAAAPGLIGEGFWRKGRIDPMIAGHAPDGLPHHDLLISGTQCLRMLHRDFLLAGTELRIVLLDGNALFLEGLDDVEDDGARSVHPNRAKTVAAIKGEKAAL